MTENVSFCLEHQIDSFFSSCFVSSFCKIHLSYLWTFGRRWLIFYKLRCHNCWGQRPEWLVLNHQSCNIYFPKVFWLLADFWRSWVVQRLRSFPNHLWSFLTKFHHQVGVDYNLTLLSLSLFMIPKYRRLYLQRWIHILVAWIFVETTLWMRIIFGSPKRSERVRLILKSAKREK